MKTPPLTESAQVLLLDHRLILLNMVFVVAILTGFGSPVMAQATASATSFEAALQRYTDDYVHDPTLVAPLVFGVDVEGEWWHVSAEPNSEGAPHSVVLKRGAPEQPTFFFSMAVIAMSVSARITIGIFYRNQLLRCSLSEPFRASPFFNVQPPQVSTELLNSFTSPHNRHLPWLTGPSGVSIIQWCVQATTSSSFA